MSIMDYIKKLLPSFGRKDVREKLRVIADRLTDMVRPALEGVAESLYEKQLVSSYGKGFMQALAKYLPPHVRNGQAPYLTVMRKSLEHAIALTDLINTYVDRHLGDQIHIEGITYQKASILRLIELLDFYGDYAIRHLAYLTAAETNISVFKQPDGNPYTKAELKFLEQHQLAFFKCLELLFDDPKKVLNEIEHIPEVLVGEAEVNEVPALTGGKADPLELGLIPVVSDIFRFVGIRKVNWQIDRFERAKKEKRSIELRLEAYREARNGRIDARTEAIIEGYEKELILLRQKINRMEEAMQ